MMKKLKYFVKEILIAAIILFILTNIISYLRKPELASTSLPKMVTELLDGSIYTLKKGKPVVIHFWATWCPTCKLEAANIESLSHVYDVLTIAVNSGSDADIQAYMSQKELTFRVVNDKDSIWAKQFNVEAYPTTFIYDANGALKFTEVGYTTTAGLLARVKIVE